MKRWVETYERFLRIPSDGRSELAMRMRAVWLIGLMVVGSQIANLLVLQFNYDVWTTDHTLSLMAVISVVASVQLVRWYKNAFFYAAFYFGLMVSAILASALADNAGINSAVVPFIVLGPIMSGFMAGRRAAGFTWAGGLIVLAVLYWISLSNPPMIAPYDYSRDTNRLFQCVFALSISMGIAVMITERIYTTLSEVRDIAARARRAEAAKSDFLATMSHEMRTPLNGVIGLTDALLNGALPTHERKLTQTIRQSGESLLQILNDLLDLSKIDAGKLTIEERPTDLRDLVRFVADNWREFAMSKGLAVTVKVTGEIPPTVMIDDLRLRQILQNLMSNGVKFTHAGQIALHLHGTMKKGDRYQLEFRVIDTGKGIPEKLIARIFEPFEQGERGTTRNYGGTGLGLPICRRLATLLGGGIEVERTSTNGSVFLLSLEASMAVSELTDLADEVYDSAGDFRGLRVLVADDIEVNRMVVGEFLKAWGAYADFAFDGPDCVAQLQQGEYDLVLMDKNMPKMNGADAARIIRSCDGPMAKVPIIAITADAMPGGREAMLAAGMNDFITKPLRAESLKAVILRTLKAREAA